MLVKEKAKKIASRATIPLGQGEILGQLNLVQHYGNDAATSTFAYIDYEKWNLDFQTASPLEVW